MVRWLKNVELEKDLEGDGNRLVEILSRYFPAVSVGTMKNLSHDGRYTRQDSNRATVEHQSIALLLCQPASYIIIIIIIIILTANGFLPGGSGNTIRQQTNNTHHTK
jgi:hypothetical protein